MEKTKSSLNFLIKYKRLMCVHSIGFNWNGNRNDFGNRKGKGERIIYSNSIRSNWKMLWKLMTNFCWRCIFHLNHYIDRLMLMERGRKMNRNKMRRAYALIKNQNASHLNRHLLNNCRDHCYIIIWSEDWLVEWVRLSVEFRSALKTPTIDVNFSNTKNKYLVKKTRENA